MFSDHEVGGSFSLTVSRVRILVLGFWVLLAAWVFLYPKASFEPTASSAGTDASGQELFWYKGNTHSHAHLTLGEYSHGDTSPAEVAKWYRDHGYHFVSVTDHNRFAEVEGLDTGAGPDPGNGEFLIIPGMEVTSDHRYPGVSQEGERKIHASALNIKEPVSWDFDDAGISSIISEQVSRIGAQNGLHVLNHPNYFFQVTLQDILDSEELSHFEIFNAHPRSNQSGHPGFRPSVEDLWDQVLSEGRLLYGVASDDAHDFKWYRRILRRFGAAPPGGGWIMVRAPDLSADGVMGAIKSGDFYASTGVHLKNVSVANGYYTVELDLQRTIEESQHRWVTAAAPVVQSDDSHHVIEFIGLHGRVLQSSHDQVKSEIRLQEGQGYIRARVTYLEKAPRILDGNRAHTYYAWTQPVMLAQGPSEQ